MTALPSLATSASPLRGTLSVDVEDYFHVEAFANIVARADWPSYPSRVVDNTRRLLDLLDEIGVTATFFIIGWVAERFPALVREILDRRHEVGCHSYWHQLISTLSREDFAQDTRRAKDVIEQAGGVPVWGYRAPSFSITAETSWAFDVLSQCGFRYDSSVFPVRHDIYGIPDAPRQPFRVQTPSGVLFEYPLTTFRYRRGPNVPVAGGGYLRLLPFWLTRAGVRRAAGEGVSIVTYVHPWEFDPDQPRLPASWRSRFRHYTNLGTTADRLRRLCGIVSYAPFRDSDPPSGQVVYTSEQFAIERRAGAR